MSSQKDNIGTTVVVTIKEDGNALDISNCTTKEIVFKKPSGDILTKTASFTTDGTDGKIEYETVADDFDETGVYELQAKIVLGGTWKTTVTRFHVLRNIE